MKKQKAKKSWFSRTILYALGLVLLVPLAYLALGCPPLTPEMAFRQAERANLLGPSTILGTESKWLDLSEERRYMVLAETDQSCMLYTYTDRTTPDNYWLYHQEKTGDATVLGVQYIQGTDDPDRPPLPIVFFDDFPEAQSAHLEWTEKSMHFISRPIFRTAQRTQPGYFLFYYDAITEITDWSDSSEIPEDTVINITVSFYREDGTLIAERSFDYSEDGTLISERSFE